eukprot:g30076.t1
MLLLIYNNKDLLVFPCTAVHSFKNLDPPCPYSEPLILFSNITGIFTLFEGPTRPLSSELQDQIPSHPSLPCFTAVLNLCNQSASNPSHNPAQISELIILSTHHHNHVSALHNTVESFYTVSSSSNSTRSTSSSSRSQISLPSAASSSSLPPSAHSNSGSHHSAFQLPSSGSTIPTSRNRSSRACRRFYQSKATAAGKRPSQPVPSGVGIRVFKKTKGMSLCYLRVFF